MLSELLEWIFPSPPKWEPSLEEVGRAFGQAFGPARDPTTIKQKAETLRRVAEYPPRAAPEPPPPQEPSDPRVELIGSLTSVLGQVARRGRDRLANASPTPIPSAEESQEALRRYALQEIKDRVMLYCLGEIQNQRPELALEFRKAWETFAALWGVMQAVDPKDVKRRVGRRLP